MLHGSSIGGGLLLGLAADQRVATKNAVFRLGVAPYGLSPVVMATKVLPLLVGGSYATRMYVEDLAVDTKLATGSGVADHLLSDSRTARRFVETSARRAGSFASASMAIAQHTRHHCQETLLDVEAGHVVSEGLMTIPVRVHSAAARVASTHVNTASFVAE